jgi:hypothetical protein
MLNRRFPLPGLFAVLLALMANLGVGASVPRVDPIAGLGVLCHPEDSGSPSKTPYHPADCPLCPLCVALHAPPATLVAAVTAPPPPGIAVVIRSELPPPSTAPPAPHRPPSQPRAPPTVS